MSETTWLSAAVLGEVVAPPADHHRARWGLGPEWHGSLVFARCEHDVVAAVRTGNRSGHGVLARGGPHHGPAASGAEVVVVTAGLDHVDVDPAAGSARVGIGATWREVARAAAPFGLTPVPGDDPDAAVGTDVLRHADGPWCRALGPVAGAVEAVDAVTHEGRLVTVPGPAALAGDRPGHPSVPTSLRLRLVPALPSTVGRARDLRSATTAAGVRRFLDATADLPDGVAAAAVVPARGDGPVTWWFAARGPARPPAGWPTDDLEVTRRPTGATLRWPPVAGRGPVGVVTLQRPPEGGSVPVAAAVTDGRRGAVVLRHRQASPSGPWLDVVVRGRAVEQVRTRLAGPLAEVVPATGTRP